MKNLARHVAGWAVCSSALLGLAQVGAAQFQTASINGAAGGITVSNNLFFLTSPAKSEGMFSAFQTFAGNGQISARIHRDARFPLKAGIVLSQSTNLTSLNASRYAGMFLADSNAVFGRLLEVKGIPASTIKTNVAGEWLRVIREGNAFSGYYSADGTNWTQISADSIEMPEQIYASLAVSGGDARFSDVKIMSAKLVNPVQKTSIVLPANISLSAIVNSFGSVPKSVEFFAEANKIGEANAAPHKMVWTNALGGSHSLIAKVTDETGAGFFTEPEVSEFKLPKASARFLGFDEVTKGNWKEKYGAEGHAIANDSTNLASIVQLTVIQGKSITWEIPASEERSLLWGDSPKRIASTWYHGTEVVLDLALADGYKHQIALYFLDWDKQERSTEVQVLDNLGNILSVQKLMDYSNGKYLIWSALGDVTFKIKRDRGGNAIVSAIFSDPER